MRAAMSAGKRMAALSGSAASNLSSWLRGASAKVADMTKTAFHFKVTTKNLFYGFCFGRRLNYK
jgi:hypothetical protein